MNAYHPCNPTRTGRSQSQTLILSKSNLSAKARGGFDQEGTQDAGYVALWIFGSLLTLSNLSLLFVEAWLSQYNFESLDFSDDSIFLNYFISFFSNKAAREAADLNV